MPRSGSAALWDFSSAAEALRATAAYEYNGGAMRLAFALLILLFLQPVVAVDTARLERGFTAAHAIPYRAIETPGRRVGEKLPLILFLHGSGQAGSDDGSQLDGQANGALELVDRALHEGVPLVFVAPQDVDTTVLLQAATERGVTFVAGSDFMLEGGRNALRLAYSAVTPEQAREGTRRLGEALASIKQPA